MKGPEVRDPGELPHGRKPDELPAGIELPDGRILTFRPSRGCPCRDCIDAFNLYDSGMLWLPLGAEQLAW